MQYVIPFILGLAVFGIFITVLVIKEKRANAKPPTHACHQIHTCQCENRQEAKSRNCTNR
jgi:hypothetical protein